MLVCNVSLRPLRAGITADIAELATAVDATATGNVVFATLVDAPASVHDIVNAYLGEIMLEAASADATVNAGLVYGAAIVEETTAITALTGVVPTVLAGAITETVSASDAPSATVVAGAAVTTTSATAVGPLFVFDPTFPSAGLTVIDAGRL